MRAPARPPPAGWTLIELCVALAILISAVVGVWSMIASSRRTAEQLWGELAAQELAVSLVERAIASGALEPTPPEGRRITLEGPDRPTGHALLHIRACPNRPELLEVRAVVLWQAAPQPPVRAEHAVLWRAGP